jgi:hypothetical protein
MGCLLNYFEPKHEWGEFGAAVLFVCSCERFKNILLAEQEEGC